MKPEGDAIAGLCHPLVRHARRNAAGTLRLAPFPGPDHSISRLSARCSFQRSMTPFASGGA
jgi:hypothetical protein